MPNEVKLLPCPFCGVSPRDGMNGRTCYHPQNNCTLDGWHFNIPNWQSRPTTVVTDEVVERVARAICGAWVAEEKAQGSIVTPWSKLSEEYKPEFRSMARAALASMPTVVTGEQPYRVWGDHALPPSGLSQSSLSQAKPAAAIARKGEVQMTDEQIKYMANRFLGWRLPENFHPDAGISFKPTFNDHMHPPMRHNPTGTNLFDATQAEAMVRFMVEGLS